MRYILDSRGYIEAVSCNQIECNNKTCTEYTGTIPTGYDSLENWVLNANIRAYKIVNGNLIFDEEEDARLQTEYEELSKTYSTIEKKIGTWIDGKPLYRKVIQFTDAVTNAARLEVPHGITNVDTIWIDTSNSFIKSGDTCCPLPLTSYFGDFEDGAGIQVNSENIFVYCQTSLGEHWTKTITLNYTKTTD